MKLGTSMTRNVLGIGITGLALACASGEADDARAVAFGEEIQISARTEVGAAPMFSVAPDGREAVAWVSAPEGGTDGRLYLSVEGADPVELTDPLIDEPVTVPLRLKALRPRPIMGDRPSTIHEVDIEEQRSDARGGRDRVPHGDAGPRS